ncbi:B-cell linker protein isoform X1 [Caretta caretta]|uniref:B-cell linker protein isoform X1 n=3 Tax=Caretta caretta TaxID=8467 RepID=UPI00209454AD|nr:B-cell linker protein isoform X1 [Caretta caretta]XP_048713073.1 B-cell linker protein isoform X1 [Caretta caretta]
MSVKQRVYCHQKQIKSSSPDSKMATKLPLREECENWTTLQVADLLRQIRMPESAVVVEKLDINGAKFLNISDYELNKFNVMHQPQLQKMVHDIKKNETGIMSKFKKFQNEQVALICKTGKNTWDRLKNKPPPSVPQRDYASEHAEDEDEQWSDDFDSDYENPDAHSDSEMYVVPSEENCDDSYEPPPTEQEKKKIPSSFSFSRGEYADNRTTHQEPLPCRPSQSLIKPKKPSKPSLPSSSAALKPKMLPKTKEFNEDEDDYIVPVDDDNNYIEPTEGSTSPSTKPPVNRSTKPTKPVLPSSTTSSPAPVSPFMLDVYEVPEEEEEPSPPTSRITKPLPPKPVQSTGGRSHLLNSAKESSKPDTSRNILPLPRNHPQQKAKHERNEAHNDENHSSTGAQDFKLPSSATPSPLPRAIKKTPNPVKPPKPSLHHKENLNVTEEKPIAAERRRGPSQEIPLPPLPTTAQKPLFQKLPALPKPPDTANRTTGTLPRSSISASLETTDQDAGVHDKAWYAAYCDRKTAEDALHKSNKDGSFLIRKSSGQDSKQPYTLVVFYNKKVYNIPVRFIESTKRYALGREKTGEERFTSVAEIIENHQHTPLVLIDNHNNTKDSTKLKHIVRVS